MPNSLKTFISVPTDHRQGNADPARAFLQLLHDAMKNPRCAQDQWSLGFVKEAEEVIEAKGGDRTK